MAVNASPGARVSDLASDQAHALVKLNEADRIWALEGRHLGLAHDDQGIATALPGSLDRAPIEGMTFDAHLRGRVTQHAAAASTLKLARPRQAAQA